MLTSFIMFMTRICLFISILAYVLGQNNIITAKQVFVVTSFYNILRQTMTVFFPQGKCEQNSTFQKGNKMFFLLLIFILKNVAELFITILPVFFCLLRNCYKKNLKFCLVDKHLGLLVWVFRFKVMLYDRIRSKTFHVYSNVLFSN